MPDEFQSLPLSLQEWIVNESRNITFTWVGDHITVDGKKCISYMYTESKQTLYSNVYYKWQGVLACTYILPFLLLSHGLKCDIFSYKRKKSQCSQHVHVCTLPFAFYGNIYYKWPGVLACTYTSPFIAQSHGLKCGIFSCGRKESRHVCECPWSLYTSCKATSETRQATYITHVYRLGQQVKHLHVNSKLHTAYLYFSLAIIGL